MQEVSAALVLPYHLLECNLAVPNGLYFLFGVSIRCYHSNRETSSLVISEVCGVQCPPLEQSLQSI